MIKIKQIVLLLAVCCGLTAAYKFGVGRADSTGPPVEVTFMGYAQLSQRGQGIHLRQFSRAFIIEDKREKRVVFVTVEAGMMGHAVKRNVIVELQKKYGNLYTFENVILSGTHTHGTPGGFLKHLLYDMTSMGLVNETFNALVRGIVQSIIRAHNNMINGRIFMSEIEVEDSNINRSPTAYDNNPEQEKAQYGANTDKTLVQMRFTDMNDKIKGAINWFAVHPTSMNNTNRLVSSDNVGYAALMLEKEFNNDLPGKGDFVGAFAATNLGDVSPNIMGPKCEKTGLPCDVSTSSCPAGDGMCFASGPGKDMFESTEIIGTRVYKGASTLLSQPPHREVTGSVYAVHQFVDMTNTTSFYYNRKKRVVEQVRGCLPAMGYSFAAGTTDGPGAFDFQQGTITENILWNFVRDFIAEPTDDDIECQKPKPILLATGRAVLPYEWQPSIVPTQMFLIGDVALAAVPGEFTTMSGRRLRNDVRKAAIQISGNDIQVIVAGLSNMYTSYVATPEEYEVQRYEGASTIYGPHTLTIYLQQYRKLIQAIIKNDALNAGPTPPNQDDKQISLTPGVIYDGSPAGKDFGYVKTQPRSSYKRGDDVYVKFVAGNPRNNLMHDKTYFTVEQKQLSGDWVVIATDANWETKFKWERVSTIFGHSDIGFTWTIGNDAPFGSYRIRHFGNSKYILGGITSYTGMSKTFVIDA